MGWLRRQADKFLLSDQDWKKKYCPTLYKCLAGEIDITKVHTRERARQLFEEGCRTGVCGVVYVETGEQHLGRMGLTVEDVTEGDADPTLGGRPIDEIQ